MRRYRNRHDGTEVALANFALTFAKALLVFCVVLFVLISPKQGTDGTKPKAEYLITIDWNTIGHYDVDIWAKLPNGSFVNYYNKESGILFLERDDLGNDCSSTTNQGKPLNDCEEIIVIRGVMQGEYAFALHMFSANGKSLAGVSITPVPVKIKIEKLNPDIKIVWQGVVILDAARQEKPFVRFSMSEDGTLNDFVTENVPSIVYSREGQTSTVDQGGR